MLKYAKMCGKYQIVRKVGKMVNCAIPHPPHLNVAYVMAHQARKLWMVHSANFLTPNRASFIVDMVLIRHILVEGVLNANFFTLLYALTR